MIDDALDALITKAADTQSAADQSTALAALAGREVYFNVGTDPEGRKTVPTVRPRPDFEGVVVYTSKDHPQLRPPFGGMTWEQVQHMVSRIPNADGVLVQSRGTGWIAVHKQDSWRDS